MGANSECKLTHHVFGLWKCDESALTKTSYEYWRQPIKWNREAEAAGERRRVFCASLADVFEDWTGTVLDHNKRRLWRRWDAKTGAIVADTRPSPRCSPLTLDDLRRDLFALIDHTPWLDWLLVTKRPENVRRMWLPSGGTGPDREYGAYEPEFYRKNIWLLTSVSNQETADRMIPELLKCRDLVPVLGISAEPLLGPLDVREWLLDNRGYFANVDEIECCGKTYKKRPGLDWVIAGCESGRNRRPMPIAAAFSLQRQCQEKGVAFFMKQMEVGETVTGEIEVFPEALQVRKYPREPAHA